MALRINSIIVAASAWCVVLLGGCGGEDEIETYRVPKEPAASATADSTPPAMSAPSPSGVAPIGWTLPAGWSVRQAGPMQYAAFQPTPNDDSVIVSVTAMPPGQSMLANVNRWEAQVGLPKSDAAQAEAKLGTLDVAGVQIRTVSLVGIAAEKPAQSIEAAFADRADHEWFFKMQGPAAKVAGLKPLFNEFMASVHFDQDVSMAGTALPPTSSNSMATPGAPGDPADMGVANDGPAVAWSVPAGWVAEAQKPMRVASWQCGSGGDGAEVIVSQFAAGSFGDMTNNVNRWRGMAGVTPATDLATSPPARVRVGSAEVDVYDFAGAGPGAKRVRVALVPTPDGRTVYFFRLHGALDAVAREQPTFDTFLNSLRFTP